jgi:hypothetical protein
VSIREGSFNRHLNYVSEPVAAGMRVGSDDPSFIPLGSTGTAVTSNYVSPTR